MISGYPGVTWKFFGRHYASEGREPERPLLEWLRPHEPPRSFQPGWNLFPDRTGYRRLYSKDIARHGPRPGQSGFFPWESVLLRKKPNYNSRKIFSPIPSRPFLFPGTLEGPWA